MEEKENKALGDEDAEERKWTDRLKKGGSVSFIDLSESCTGWSTPPGNFFVVRGPQYLTDKVKISGGDPLLTPLAFDWLKSGSRIDNVMGHPSSRVMKALDQASKRGKGKPFVWAFNLQVPSKEHFSAVSYFVSYNDFPEGSLWDQILKGDDAHRNTRLKLIANIVEGPWIVKTAVGAHAICILGKSLTCRYLQGENFLEVDVDIGSSMVANAIVHLAIGYINSLSVDMAFLIEGQAEEELPEKLLGTIRLKLLDLSAAVPLELLSKEEGTNFGGFISIQVSARYEIKTSCLQRDNLSYWVMLKMPGNFHQMETAAVIDYILEHPFIARNLHARSLLGAILAQDGDHKSWALLLFGAKHHNTEMVYTLLELRKLSL